MGPLNDVARFTATDPGGLVAAAFACPLCLRGESTERTHLLEGYDPCVSCRCPMCDARWRVYLTPEQALRLGLMPASG